MTKIHPDELGRRTAGLSNLFPDGRRMLMAASVGSSRTDGHYDGPHVAASCIVKFKDELVDIKSLFEVELGAYTARSHK